MNVFVGLGDESFDARSVYSTGSTSDSNSIVAGDLNKDGRMDVIIANQGTYNVSIFLAFDYVLFINYVVDMPGLILIPYYVATGDINNDHLVDMTIVNKGANNLGIYLEYDR